MAGFAAGIHRPYLMRLPKGTISNMVAALVFLVVGVLGQEVSPPADVQNQFVGQSVLDKVIQAGVPIRKRPIGEIMAVVSDQLVGTPYVGWTLERGDLTEKCFVTLEGLDCVSFFESTLALARMVRADESSPEQLLAQVTRTRYRGGKVNGYPSRLHYTSDWMEDNVKKGIVSDLSIILPGSKRFDKKIHFMTSNTATYRQLTADPKLVSAIKKTEDAINKRAMHYVPLDAVSRAEELLRTGDIIGITTSQPGMDCSHTGIIRVIDDVPHFMHASSVMKKVVLDVRLSEYLKTSPRATGIMAVRPR